MKKTIDIPESPRWNMVEDIADHLLLLLDVTIPVNPLEVLQSFSCRVYTYQELAEQCDMRVSDVCDEFDSDDGGLWYNTKTQEYIVAYNHSVCPEGRIRWTLAHELGHIALGHLEDFPQTRLSNFTVTPEELKVLDQEANKFASEVLAPTVLLFGLADKAQNYTEEFYYALSRDVFHLSCQAALYRAKSISARQSIIAKKLRHLPPYAETYFSPYIDQYAWTASQTAASSTWLHSFSAEFSQTSKASISRNGGI